MKAVLKNTITNEILIEIADNLETELSDDEIQEFLNGYELTEEELDTIYVDYQ